MKNVFEQIVKRMAQQESNAQLGAKVMYGKYIPKSVKKALIRREKLINMG